jgi:outer membrane beta-barrel protein
MESRLRIFLLTGVALGTLSGCGLFRGGDEPVVNDERVAVVDPRVERRDIVVPDIDTENFEVGLYAGLLSIEDFGTNTVIGARAAYHVTEDFFVEGVIGSSDAGLTSFENLSGGAQLFTSDQRRFRFYNMSVGYNLLPGEVFLGSRLAFNTALYVIAGVGNTQFGGDDHFTVNAGLGLRVFPKDWIALHVDVRDHMFDTDLLGEKKTTHNVEGHLGFTIFF